MSPTAASPWTTRTFGEAELCVTRLADHATPEGSDWLDAGERARFATLGAAIQRERFLTVRWLLRQALSRRLPGDAGDLAFDAPRGAKPRIASANPDGLKFNLSHTGDTLAVLTAFDREPGVDIETPRPGRDSLALARRYYDPREIAWLERLPSDARAEGFLRLWTLKEALLKAMGLGLRAGLASCVLDIADDRPRLVACTAGPARAWTLESFRLDDGSHCAVALG